MKANETRNLGFGILCLGIISFLLFKGNMLIIAAIVMGMGLMLISIREKESKN